MAEIPRSERRTQNRVVTPFTDHLTGRLSWLPLPRPATGASGRTPQLFGDTPFLSGPHYIRRG